MFLDRVRVTAAKADLDEGLLTAEQIAYARGFGTTSTMRRTFLRVLGEPPSRCRDASRQSSMVTAASAA
jgi:transcriptional regulator GlxA family with amidase domain